MKLLSIVIPTYNMEKYLRKCLDSFVVSDDVMKYLEVIIVNDGSKDSSSEIAHEYEFKYPQVFHVIDKENGNYGSCINRGLKESSGKYFRVLDADDYFNKNGVEKFIENLASLQTDVDVIYTAYQINYMEEGKSKKVINHDFLFNRIINLYEETIPNPNFDNLTMHTISYNTEFLRRINYFQQEGISYTDTEYVYYPLIMAKTLIPFDIVLYCYNIGREGQTVSVDSMIKNRDSYTKLYSRFIKDYNYIKGNLSSMTVRRNILTSIVHNMLRIYIKYSSYDIKIEKELRCILKEIKDSDRELYNLIIYKKVHGLHPYKLWEILGKLWFVIYNRLF